jgi:hypothetical protein
LFAGHGADVVVHAQHLHARDPIDQRSVNTPATEARNKLGIMIELLGPLPRLACASFGIDHVQ